MSLSCKTLPEGPSLLVMLTTGQSRHLMKADPHGIEQMTGQQSKELLQGTQLIFQFHLSINFILFPGKSRQNASMFIRCWINYSIKIQVAQLFIHSYL